MSTNQKKNVIFVLTLGIIITIAYFSTNQNNEASSNSIMEEPSINTVGEQSEIKIAALPESVSKTALQLISMSHNNLRKSEGWVHIITTVKSDLPTGVFLPDGSEMPSNYIDECWCYIDKKGFSIKYVHILKDEDGNILQQVGYQDGVLVNFTLGTREENFPSFELMLDGGVIQALVDAETSGVPIEKQEVKFKDKNHIKFSYNQKYEKAIEIGGISELVEGFSVELLFSPETGNLVSYSNIAQLKNKQEILFAGQYLDLAEATDSAPNEILMILENIK